MKTYLIILVFIGFFKFYQAEADVKENSTDTDIPEMCYHNDTKHAFAAGRIYKPIGICEAMFCTKDLEIKSYDCSIAKRIDCKPLEMDLTKPHPFCCPKYLCNHTNGDEYETQ